MERLITFDSITCCALAHAFAKHHSLLAQWGTVMLRLYADILVRSQQLTFSRDAEVIAIYHAFSVAERERLALSSGDHSLRCRHSPTAHVKALDTVIRQAPTSQ